MTKLCLVDNLLLLSNKSCGVNKRDDASSSSSVFPDPSSSHMEQMRSVFMMANQNKVKDKYIEHSTTTELD